jgi:hypothetical protein
MQTYKEPLPSRNTLEEEAERLRELAKKARPPSTLMAKRLRRHDAVVPTRPIRTATARRGHRCRGSPTTQLSVVTSAARTQRCVSKS